MNTNNRFSRNVPCVWALLALAAGCASLDLPDPPVADVTRKRQQRAEEVVLEFESKRDFAELQVPMTYWNQGDIDACEQELRLLLKRNPDHRHARLLMAEVRRTDKPSQATLDQIEQALLDATGEGNSDLDFYERVAELGADKTVTTVAHETAPPAAEQVEPSPAGPTGQSGDSPRTYPETTFVVPDPTAHTVKSASTLPVKRPNRPDAAAGADDKPQPSTTPDRDSQTETSDRVDLADSAETAAMGRVRSLLDKGREALAEGSAEAAMTQFRKAAGIRPDNPQIPITAATAALRHNRPELAIELLLPAERRFSGSARLYRVLGLSYYRLGDYRSSQVALRQALSLDKSSALSYLLMGCTLSKLGQFESAEAHLRQARTIDPRYTVRR